MWKQYKRIFDKWLAYFIAAGLPEDLAADRARGATRCELADLDEKARTSGQQHGA